jgi:hypothetical protein
MPSSIPAFPLSPGPNDEKSKNYAIWRIASCSCISYTDIAGYCLRRKLNFIRGYLQKGEPWNTVQKNILGMPSVPLFAMIFPGS